MSGRRPPGEREKAQERRLKAFELRKAGASYRVIAKALGCGERTAWRDVMARLQELAKLEDGEREAVRRLELERCDALLLGHFSRATQGDAAAAKIVLQVLERRAKLLGIDAPTKIAPTDTEGRSLAEYVAEWGSAPEPSDAK